MINIFEPLYEFLGCYDERYFNLEDSDIKHLQTSRFWICVFIWALFCVIHLIISFGHAIYWRKAMTEGYNIANNP